MEIKKTIFFIIISLFLTNSIFANNEINSYNYLKLEIENDINFDISFEKEYKVSELNLISYFFPQTFNGSQYLNNFESNIESYKILDDETKYFLKYSYDETNLKKNNNIKNKFILESTKYKPEVKEKITYPLKEKYINDINQKNLEFTNLIDIDENIKTQASDLAQGEDDVYIIASKVAKWIIEDIEYDLNTVFENPNQKSSQVFKSKTGVCKEITNLFVSMMRSLGIPSRVVVGYAYTDSEELVNFVGSNWGGHAWAEILIGDIWVPFDLTYNQYGFVDATHIVTDKHHEIRSKNLELSGTGYGFKIVENTLRDGPKFTILDKKKSITQDNFKFEISGPKEVGFDSYGYLKIKTKNKKDYYQLLFLNFAMPKEIELLDSNEKMFVFKPNEEKEIYFRYKIPQNLDEDYSYIFPFTIYNQEIQESYNISVQKSFLKIKELALPKQETQNNELSNNNLTLNCNFILDIPSNLVLCSMRNRNNFELNNVKICFEKNCKTIELKVNEIKSVTFETNELEGELNYFSKINNDNITIKANIPNINITNYNASILNLKINLKIEDYINNLNLKITNSTSTIQEISPKEKEYVEIKLNPGKQDINLELYFKNKLISKKIINVEIKDKKIFEKILDWIKEKITF